MSFIIQDPRIGVQQIATTSTVQKHALGMRVKAVDPTLGEGEFIYLKGLDSTAVGEWVLIAESDFSTSLLVADDIGQVALAMSICLTDSFGWYQIYGKATGLVAASCADDKEMFSTSTAGTADDAVVAGDRIQNCKSASAIDTPSTGLAYMEIAYPHCDNALAQ